MLTKFSCFQEKNLSETCFDYVTILNFICREIRRQIESLAISTGSASPGGNESVRGRKTETNKTWWKERDWELKGKMKRKTEREGKCIDKVK